MYLKRLDLQGFKSFVDKTTLEFSGGITSVIGPNGSGKSNIADAIRWVLGEQSAKTLRGGKMEDVIFVGTENRRPVSFAEVSLTLDNSDSHLPIDYEEVTVTRRLYRSGESEYLINKTPCRLKDIHQLFMDTGIGVDGYSIIGQGKVDEILSGRPEDRRAIFEEASGIMKYKKRKIESERKLEATTQNIERLNDIIFELESQLEPLAEQSEKAKKYLDYTYELKDYEISLYVEKILNIHKQLDEFNEKYLILRNDIDKQNELLEKLKQENTVKNERFKYIDDKLNASREKYYEIEKQLADFYNDIKVIEGRISNLTNENEKISENIKEYKQKRESAENKILELENVNVALNESYSKAEESLKALEDKYNHILSQMASSSQNLEALRKEQIELNNRLSELRIYRDRNLGDTERLKERKLELTLNLQEVIKVKVEAENENKVLLDTGDKLKLELAQLKEEVSNLNNFKNETKRRIELLRKDEDATRKQYHHKSSELNVLRRMEDNFEGYVRSVKEILSLVKKGSNVTSGVKGAVVQLINVDKRYEIAIETALGQASQNIVTETEEDAKVVIEYLKANKLGRATFLPMSSIKGSPISKNIIDQLRKEKGFIGVANDLITYEPQYKDIMLSLLGKVIIVDNLDNAIAISKKFKYFSKIITLEGDIIRTSGAITGGSFDKGARIGVLSRSNTIKELESTTADIRNKLNKIINEIEELLNKLSETSQKIKDLDSKRMSLELKVVEVDGELKRYKERISELDLKSNQSERELQEIDVKLEGLKNDLLTIEKEISNVEGELKSVGTRIVNSESENQSGRSTLDAVNNTLTEKKIEVNNLMHQINNNKDEIQRLKLSIEEMDNLIMKNSEEYKRNETTILDLRTQIEGLNKSIQSKTELKTGQNLEIEKLLEEKNVLNQELSEMMTKNNEVTDKLYKLQEEYSRLEVRKSRLETEEENYKNRLWEDYEITLNNAIEQIKDKDFGSLASRQKKVNEIKNLIKGLGAVNVNAIEDYKNTKERYEFLSAQKEDMEQSKVKLIKVIDDMTSIMKKQFLEQLEKINQSFSETFKELFDGGNANIILQDESDVLASVIEIEAQPPGKKLQNMMLLSGGERALTAIALLFAILKLKPTPFCVLDEIEAALDDANVYRFAEYIQNFSNNSQFIVITHRKGTMEVSDTMYGVTMEEKGISKVVSMKF